MYLCGWTRDDTYWVSWWQQGDCIAIGEGKTPLEAHADLLVNDATDAESL
jgi:hypothetical protein